jgi:hypothetical protein
VYQERALVCTCCQQLAGFLAWLWAPSSWLQQRAGGAQVTRQYPRWNRYKKLRSHGNTTTPGEAAAWNDKQNVLLEQGAQQWPMSESPLATGGKAAQMMSSAETGKPKAKRDHKEDPTQPDRKVRATTHFSKPGKI